MSYFKVDSANSQPSKTRAPPDHSAWIPGSISGDPVVSTTLHHLVEFSKAKEIIIKIDIEVCFLKQFFNIICIDCNVQGFECKVLAPYLSKPTQKVFIPFIFMEWMHIKRNLDDNCPNLENLVQLFTDLDYIPWDASKRIHLKAKSKRLKSL